VIAGFVLGFSIGIVVDQSHKLLGVPAPSGSYLQELWGTLKELPETSGTTLSVGAGSLAVLLLMRYLLPKWPRAPIVMALSIPAVNRFDLADHGVAVTREVPTGLFSIGLPDIDWCDCGTLLTGLWRWPSSATSNRLPPHAPWRSRTATTSIRTKN
jgi:sulfate permease, SulP family